MYSHFSANNEGKICFKHIVIMVKIFTHGHEDYISAQGKIYFEWLFNTWYQDFLDLFF